MNLRVGLVFGVMLAAGSRGWAETTCAGEAVAGIVRDNTQAVIAGARVALDGGAGVQSDAAGRFRFGCVGAGTHTVLATADGFAAEEMRFRVPVRTELLVTLHAGAALDVEVNAEDEIVPTETGMGATTTVSGKALQSLADDPDDLLRELQQLAATAGGSAGSATISVDGFQDSSHLPPKSSIAYIKVNPDLFSAEYREPPFGGGRVEIYTRPGQKAFHGAVFTTNGSSWENARDPFSTSKAAVGKQRYGFELSGPVRKVGSDFFVNLEHRSIDNYAVVNAVTVDGGGNAVSTVANVAAPQRLWLGGAKVNWQVNAKNTFSVGVSTSQNGLQNVGVGGATLAEAGYGASQWDNTLRLSNVTTATAKLMHETRLSLRWDGEEDTPNSTAPQVSVAGAFTGGGASIGARQLRELRMELDDDAVLVMGRHTLKVGTQMFFNDEHDRMTNYFNGSYVFGGGPGLTGLAQYMAALAGQTGGTPTAYTGVAGDPELDFKQVTAAFFVQEDWNLPHGVHVSGGVRYFVQNAPTILDGATPRVGIAWAPGKKPRWSVNAHAGMFAGNFGVSTYREEAREDGRARVTSTIYNPVYGNPYAAGAVPIESMRVISPKISSTFWAAEVVGGSYAFPGGWNVSGNAGFGRIWNYVRTVNVNSPLNGVPTGPRPGVANLNVLHVQNSGQGRADLEIMMVEQHSLKHVQVMVGAVHSNVVADSDDGVTSGPQSSQTDAGEFARRAGDTPWNVFGNWTVKLPYKVDWSSDFNASGKAAYNITTGFDNNGDGNFNDRPQYAAAGTPGAVATPWGLLVSSGGTGVFPRDKGTMPWTIHLDMNVQRSFVLTRNAKAEHQQKLTVNVRSSNVLNHLNVTSVGGVLGSPQFGVPYAADNGRRVEAGLRYGF